MTMHKHRPSRVRVNESTRAFALKWIEETATAMVNEGKLPDIGRQFSDEARAQHAIRSIIERKLKYWGQQTAQQRAFWQVADDLLTEMNIATAKRDTAAFQPVLAEMDREFAGKESLRAVREEQLVQEYRARYASKPAILNDPDFGAMVEGFVQKKLREENLL